MDRKFSLFIHVHFFCYVSISHSNVDHLKFIFNFAVSVLFAFSIPNSDIMLKVYILVFGLLSDVEKPVDDTVKRQIFESVNADKRCFVPIAFVSLLTHNFAIYCFIFAYPCRLLIISGTAACYETIQPIK